MASSPIEIDHIIGFSGKYKQSLHYHNKMPGIILYSIGSYIIIEDINDKHKQTVLKGHDNDISILALSNSGKLVASGQIGSIIQKNPIAPIIIWDIEKKKSVFILKGLEMEVTQLSFSKDDRFLAAYGLNNLLLIMDCKDGSTILNKYLEFPLSFICWGDLFAGSSQKHPSYFFMMGHSKDVFICTFEFDIASMQYNMKSGKCQLPSTGLVRNYTSSQISKEFLYLGTNVGEICVFHIYTRLYKGAIQVSSNGLFSFIAIDDYIFAGGGEGKLRKLNIKEFLNWSVDKELQLDGKIMNITSDVEKKEVLCGTSTGKIYRVLTSDLSAHLHTDSHIASLNDVAFPLNSNEMFGTIDDIGVVKVWDTSEYRVIFNAFSDTKEQGSSLCFDNEVSLITGWKGGSIKCYDIKEKTLLWSIAIAHRGAVNCIYSDANYMLTCGEDGPIRVWSKETHKLLLQLSGHAKSAVKVFPDFKNPQLIHSCGIDKVINTYDLKKEKKANGYAIKNGYFTDMCQRKDNELELVTAGHGCPIQFWDVDYPDAVAKIETKETISSIEISHNAHYLVVSTAETDFMIFDIKDQSKISMIIRIESHSRKLNKVRWSPDDKQLVAIGKDGALCIFNSFL